jgi:hypothetical protein
VIQIPVFVGYCDNFLAKGFRHVMGENVLHLTIDQIHLIVFDIRLILKLWHADSHAYRPVLELLEESIDALESLEVANSGAGSEARHRHHRGENVESSKRDYPLQCAYH